MLKNNVHFEIAVFGKKYSKAEMQRIASGIAAKHCLRRFAQNFDDLDIFALLPRIGGREHFWQELIDLFG